MNIEVLRETVKALVAHGKGILATDASEGTMDKRLIKVGIEPSAEIRRVFREILLTTSGVGEFISGVILNDEIIRQTLKDGTPFTEQVKKQGMIPGIKVDKKAHDMANFPGEKIAEGLDGLRDRFAEYKQMGARFAKWRAVIAIGEGIPTDVCIGSNSEALARYAALAQEADIVPIVELEVLMDGNHDIDRCAEVSREALKSVFKSLSYHKIFLGGLLLKPNMVLPGKESGQSLSAQEVAQKTLTVLKESVPDEVLGVAFLSGGQKPEEATLRLNEMNKMGVVTWQLTFSFERALEDYSMDAWKGKDEDVEAAQKEFYKRAKLNSLARTGRYEKEMENQR